jgi:hypothetical protein
LLYAGIDTFGDRGKAFDEMEQRVEEGATSFKFYPGNGLFDKISNDFVTLFYDDPENAYPYFEKCIDLGIKTVAIHKSQPMGGLPMSKVSIADVSLAASRYPELNFELVHTGWAFVEEAAYQLAGFPNIYANLENCVAWAVRQPLQFAHMLGKFLAIAPAERLIFASGCALNHPDPQIQAFLDFQMPEDLQEGYGYPPLTLDLKRKILGENYAQLHRLDIPAIKASIRNDRWSQLRAQGKAKPWSKRRERFPDQEAVQPVLESELA